MDSLTPYPDITEIIARKARGRRDRAALGFGEKLEIVDKLRDEAVAIAQARLVRPRSGQGGGGVTKPRG